MLNGISWHDYITFLAASTVLYYLVVYFLYFRNSIEASFVRRGKSFKSELSVKEQPPTLFDQNAHEEHNLQNVVYGCMDELNAYFENQKISKTIKSELMYGLYRILQKYPSLRNSDYKESISNIIATQSENICSIHLSAEELKGVWFG